MTKTAQDEASLEKRILELLEREEYSGHELRETLSELFGDYRDHRAQLERLASISDGYQSIIRDRNRSLIERYDKQVRHLQKLVKISDLYQHNLQDLNEALRIASLHDPLTNLPNRRFIIESLQHETAAVERGRKPFSLAIFDVDYFKTINDDWGHEAGDAALIAIAQTVTHSLRAYDVCARWGGEEFLILLPETSDKKALEIAERLRVQINELSLPNLPPTRKITVSIGVAAYQLKTDYNQTIKHADDALFQAKREGRNRAALWKA